MKQINGGGKLDILVIRFQKTQDMHLAEQILKQLLPLCRKLIRKYWKIGTMESEDKLQVASIALFTAMNTYNSSRSAFKTHAQNLISRSLSDELHRSQTKQNLFELDNDCIDTILEDTDNPPPQFIDKNALNPELNFIEHFDINLAIATVAQLARILPESQQKLATTLKLIYEGYSYDEISQKINLPVKSIDNVLTQARRILKDKGVTPQMFLEMINRSEPK